VGCRRADPDFRAAVSTTWPASSGTPYRRFVAGLCVRVSTLVRPGVIGDLSRTAGNATGQQCAVAPGDEHSRFVCGLRAAAPQCRRGGLPRGRNLIVLARGVVDDRVGVKVPTGAVLAPSLGARRCGAREG